jgi:6-phosphofructokinase 2
LKTALEAGVYLIKPSLREFRDLMGQSLASHAELIAACQFLVESGRAEIVALTLGEQGALLVTHDQVLGAQALPIKPVSVVGAADSFLGAMIWSLASGHLLPTAFRYGIAAGSAALLPGEDHQSHATTPSTIPTWPSPHIGSISREYSSAWREAPSSAKTCR